MHEYLMVVKVELNHIQKQQKREREKKGGRALYLHICFDKNKSEFGLKKKKNEFYSTLKVMCMIGVSAPLTNATAVAGGGGRG